MLAHYSTILLIAIPTTNYTTAASRDQATHLPSKSRPTHDKTMRETKTVLTKTHLQCKTTTRSRITIEGEEPNWIGARKSRALAPCNKRRNQYKARPLQPAQAISVAPPEAPIPPSAIDSATLG
ncbi:hypothetical protein HOY80DRAFT_997238 [Tuber brumale]|nr:hypothetical protein HOY80DRAFT_997238 [Tuber brumale]